MKSWRGLSRRWFRTDSLRRILTIVPSRLVKSLVTELKLDRNAKKLTLERFLRFMVLALLLHHGKPSLRRLARVSHRRIIQVLTGLRGISHSSIGAYLNRVSLEALQRILAFLVAAAKGAASTKRFRWGVLRVADATTIPVSPRLHPWAAPNGEHHAIRMTLVMNPRTWVPHAVIDSSRNTNDNVTFGQVVASLNRGDVLVVDPGYTKLAHFKAILARGADFIAGMSQSYHVERLHRRQLPTGARAIYEGWRVVEDARVLVGTPRSGGPIEARRLVFQRHISATKVSTRVVWTSLFSATPKQIIRAYVWRWRVEIQFRWLKSELGFDHVPSRDPHGVYAYFLLMLIAWTVLLLYKAHVRGDRSDRLSVAALRDHLTAAVETVALSPCGVAVTV